MKQKIPTISETLSKLTPITEEGIEIIGGSTDKEWLYWASNKTISDMKKDDVDFMYRMIEIKNEIDEEYAKKEIIFREKMDRCKTKEEKHKVLQEEISRLDKYEVVEL